MPTRRKSIKNKVKSRRRKSPKQKSKSRRHKSSSLRKSSNYRKKFSSFIKRSRVNDDKLQERIIEFADTLVSNMPGEPLSLYARIKTEPSVGNPHQSNANEGLFKAGSAVSEYYKRRFIDYREQLQQEEELNDLLQKISANSISNIDPIKEGMEKLNSIFSIIDANESGRQVTEIVDNWKSVYNIWLHLYDTYFTVPPNIYLQQNFVHNTTEDAKKLSIETQKLIYKINLFDFGTQFLWKLRRLLSVIARRVQIYVQYINLKTPEEKANFPYN